MAFKMKGSPMQRNYGISPVKSIIGDVVASVGSQLSGISKDVKKTTKKIFGKENIEERRNKQIEKNKGTEYQGMTNFERRQADRAAQRESGGKSKFQRDIIKKRADRKAKKPAKTTVVSDEAKAKGVKRTEAHNIRYAEQQVKLKKKVKKKIVTPTTDYTSMSVNDLVKLREGGNKDVQGIINSKLKANPNKWD